MASKGIGVALGRKIAPWRFLTFIGAFVIGLGILVPRLDPGIGTMVSFDIASALFLALTAPLLGREANDMRQYARDNDAKAFTATYVGELGEE